jgi:hypothetical protein
MKHARIELNITDWLIGNPPKSPRNAIVEFVNFMVDRGYKSLEHEVSSMLNDFLGQPIDQSHLPEASGQLDIVYAGIRETPSIFTTCLKKDNITLFGDIQRSRGEKQEIYYVEVDIFSSDSFSIQSNKETLVDDIMKCFGLTKSKNDLIKGETSRAGFFRVLMKNFKTSEPLSNALFERLKEKIDREILIELKKRGSIIERDLHELASPSVKVDRIKSALDYFSGEEYRLIDRKFAIICNKTNEIIFLLRNKEDLENAKQLECPKCSAQIGNESVLSYYERTEKLKELLDGNRWMPLLIRDAFIKAGVPESDVYTEVKYGEDEIDVLALYRGRVLVVELKDRPASLNDAYKLSAKTSRLESISIRSAPASLDEDILGPPEAYEIYAHTSRVRPARGMFVPIVISSYDIAKDARDLLKETKENARFLENCEGKIDDFARKIVNDIDDNELRRRLVDLISVQSHDSISNLAAAQIDYAFNQWARKEGS